jgi:hypothetical protein
MVPIDKSRLIRAGLTLVAFLIGTSLIQYFVLFRHAPQRALLITAPPHPLPNMTITIRHGPRTRVVKTDRDGRFMLNGDEVAFGKVDGYVLTRITDGTYVFGPAGRLVITAVDKKGKPFKMIDVDFNLPEYTGERHVYTAMTGLFVEDGMPVDIDGRAIKVGVNGKKFHIVGMHYKSATTQELVIEYVLDVP